MPVTVCEFESHSAHQCMKRVSFEREKLFFISLSAPKDKFLQVAGIKGKERFCSCKLQELKVSKGFVPASCRN